MSLVYHSSHRIFHCTAQNTRVFNATFMHFYGLLSLA